MATPASYNTPPAKSVTQSVLDNNNNARAVARMANPQATPTAVVNASGVFSQGGNNRVVIDQYGLPTQENVQARGIASTGATAQQARDAGYTGALNPLANIDVATRQGLYQDPSIRGVEEALRPSLAGLSANDQLAAMSKAQNDAVINLARQRGLITGDTTQPNLAVNSTLPSFNSFDQANGITSPIIGTAYRASATRNPATGAVTNTSPANNMPSAAPQGGNLLQQLAAKRAQTQAGWGVTGTAANGQPIIGGNTNVSNTTNTNTTNATNTVPTSLNTGATGASGANGVYTADQQAILSLMGRSQEEKDAQAQLDALLSQTAAGKANVATQAIPMNFITGQQQQIEARSLANADPLTRQLARMQADREAQLGVQGKKYEFDTANAKATADAQKTATDKQDKLDAKNTENVGTFQKYVSDFLKSYSLSPSAATAKVINELAPLVQSGQMTPEAAYLQYQIAAGTNPSVAAQNAVAAGKAAKTSGGSGTKSFIDSLTTPQKVEDAMTNSFIDPEGYLIKMTTLGVPYDQVKKNLLTRGFLVNPDGSIIEVSLPQ